MLVSHKWLIEKLFVQLLNVEGKFVRQSGGKGQYGHVWLKMEPLPEGEGFEFVDEITGGVVPKEYIPAIEKGCQRANG